MPNIRVAFLAASAGLLVVGCRHAEQPVTTAPSTSPIAESTEVVNTTKGVTEAQLGVPFYPGSKEKGTSSRVMESDMERTVFCERTSSDDPAKIADFYQPKLTSPKKSSLPNMVLIAGSLKDGSVAQIQIAKSGEHLTEIGMTVHKLKKKA